MDNVINQDVEKRGIANQLLEEGEFLCGQVQIVINRLYVKYHKSPLPDYIDVHLLVCTFEAMFPKLLKAQHGFLIDIAPLVDGVLVHKDWRHHDLVSKTPGSRNLSVMMKQIPHSWLLHPESGTIIDVIPLGCKPGITYPVCRPPHPNRPKYVSDIVQFKHLHGKLPDHTVINELRRDLEEWSKDVAWAFIFD